VLDSTLRLSTPLLLACLAGFYSERSGVFDIGLEGKMLAAAFAAAARRRSPARRLDRAAGRHLASVALALIHGFACITARGNQIVSGVAINFLAAGLTALLGQAWFRQGGKTPPLPSDARFDGAAEWPLRRGAGARAVSARVYSGLLSGHSCWSIVAFAPAPAPGGCSGARASGCGCARWARTRRRSTRPGSGDGGCATGVICCGALCGLAGPICRSRSRRAS
jgi:ABC-type uncharacterized transport system permease subunit